MAIYDDRLEVTSPGGLYNGLTFEDMMHGHSKLRNRAIANVFSQMGLVESWGTGIKKIIDSAKEYGLHEPEFIEMPETFCVNLFRKVSPTRSDGDVGENSVKFGENVTIKGDFSTETSTETGTEMKNGGTQVKNYGTETSTKNVDTCTGIKITGTENKILSMIAENPRITIMEMAERIGMSKNGIIYSMDKLRKENIISREGAQKNGKWIINEEE